jgi:Ca2+-transporting ATPase
LVVQGFFSNAALAATVIVAIALQACTIFVPAFQPVFKTQALSFGETIAVLLISCVVLFAVEIEKLWYRRRHATAVGSIR